MFASAKGVKNMMMLFKKAFHKKLPHSHFDRLYHSERQLIELQKLEDATLISSYETLLKPAITRIYRVLNEIPNHQYANMDPLSSDYIFVDVGIIPYYDTDNMITYMTLRKAKALKYPQGAYQIDDKKIGRCHNDKEEQFISQRIAVDYYIRLMAEKWLTEIPTIRQIIEEYLQQEEK